MANKTTVRSHTIAGLVTLGLISLATTASAFAEEKEADSRWHPWLGCWQLWEEQLDPAAASTPTLTDTDDETAALLDRTRVCVRPGSTTDSVDLTAVAGDRVLVERTLVADGARRDVREAECVGWEQSEWSFDGHRLFTHAELQCGDEPARTVTGVSLLSSASIWVDIQVVEVGTRQLVEVRRYSPTSAARQDTWLGSGALGVDATDIRQARREAAEAIDLRDIEEASQRTTTRVVETLLVETEPRLPLDSEALIALDDAGINGGVIDLLVGLSYPDHFVVERRDRGGSWASGAHSGFGGYHDPMWYGSYYPYYVTPLGYYSWRRGYNPYLFGGAATTPFIVVPGVNDNDSAEGTGRMVHERGYTRVSPRTTGGRTAVPRGASASPGGYSSGGGTTSRTGSSGTSSSGGGASRGGSSSGGRKAVPRR